VNDSRSSWSHRPERMYMRHDIVSTLLLFDGGDLKLSGCKVLLERQVSSSHRSHFKDVTRTKFASICWMASSEIGRPSCLSAMARFSHSLRQVKNRFC